MSAPLTEHHQIHLNGPEYGVDYMSPRGSFSQAQPGVYDTDYHYDLQPSLDYLASRGWTVVKVPIRWERIQRVISGPLDPGEVGRLDAFIERCGNAGLAVNLDVHNYGRYYLDVDGVGKRTPIGHPEVPAHAFADLWRRLAEHYGDNDTVITYNLCAEPHGTEGFTAETWHDASQAAVTAIRKVDRDTEVHVAGFNWSSLRWWRTTNPDPWIDDPADNFRYVAHHYWDIGGGGEYEESFSSVVRRASREGFSAGKNATALHSLLLHSLDDWASWLDKAGARGFIGEIGWPHGSRKWNALADWYFHRVAEKKIPVAVWCAGEWADWDELSLYEGHPISSARESARIAERHLRPARD